MHCRKWDECHRWTQYSGGYCNPCYVDLTTEELDAHRARTQAAGAGDRKSEAGTEAQVVDVVTNDKVEDDDEEEEEPVTYFEEDDAGNTWRRCSQRRCETWICLPDSMCGFHFEQKQRRDRALQRLRDAKAKAAANKPVANKPAASTSSSKPATAAAT